MFQRFTDRARRVIVYAQDEARSHGHDHIGTEHLLLGIVHEGAGTAVTTLTACGVSLDALRATVDEIIGRGPGPDVARVHIPFTPRAKKVLELSLRESLQLGHDYIGTEHLLLALTRDWGSIAANVLTMHGLTYTDLHQQLAGIPDGTSEPGRAVKVAVPAEALRPDRDERDERPERPDEARADGSGNLADRLQSILTRLARIEERLRTE